MLTSRPIPITRDLVLLGGGHTHALVLLKWAMNPLPGAQITLIDPHVKAPYTGMLPGLIAGHYKRCHLDIDLVQLARRANARLVTDYAVGIDKTHKRVQLSNRPDISFDTLSIDIGITTELPAIHGAATHAVSAKPLGPFADTWESFLIRAHQDGIIPEIAVIGGGVAGVELALAMAHRLQSENVKDARVRLIEAEPEILRELVPTARRGLLSELSRYGIEIVLGANVEEITEKETFFASGMPPIPANYVVTASGATPHPWLTQTGLELHNGYIEVDNRLRATNAPHVFAAGDCAHLTFSPRPKAGVFAVRQAPVLFENLRADLSGQKMVCYRPQKSYLKLISMGQKSAIADKWGLAPRGKSVWRLKNRIDQAFMDNFRKLPNRAMPDLPQDIALGVKSLLSDDAMQCGGCGSKIGQAPLLEGLSGKSDRSNLGFSDYADDAAIIEKENCTEVLSADHLRTFTPDAWLLAKVAAVHAMGDIWAMGAKPDAVLSHITLPQLAPHQQANMIREIMDGANEIFSACGTKIIGGHTSSGAELTIGFTITGNAERPVTLSGAREGDALLLTKPVGSGLLLAAEMRQMADGDDYRDALESMCRLQDKAASLLAPIATAMTDVTGFGLAGHLMNILKASRVSAKLNIDKIPLLAGVQALSDQGIRSTLWPSNAELTSRMSIQASPKSDLLFDPQTCGGLLACVPQSKIDQLETDFELAGEPIWKIGEIKSGKPYINVR